MATRRRGWIRPAAGCPERVDPESLRFAWSWNRSGRASTHALAVSFPGRAIVLRGRREQMRFDREHVGPAG